MIRQNQKTKEKKQEIRLTDPKEVRKAYEQQREVGWKNYLRGRLVQEWGSVLKSLPGKQVTRLKLKSDIARILLEWLHQKWLLRCSLAEKPEQTREYERVQREGEELWDRRQRIALLAKDSYPLIERNNPKLQ